MLNQYRKQTLPFKEFIALMAMMMSLVALSIDSILPALESIGASMGNTNSNDNQFMIAFFMVGLACGQLVFGPWSDSVGRRKAMLVGLSIFFIGSLLAIYSTDYNTILFSRFLQGIGVSAPRVLSMTIIRDLFQGRPMAKVMSFVSMIFVFVPMLAPMMGQAILTLFNWRAIFIFTGLFGFVLLSWYLIRQAETLNPTDRTNFTWGRVKKGLTAVFKDRVVIGYTLASGLIFGPFLFFLSSSPQLFQVKYELAENFPYYFAGISSVLGGAALFNGKKVMKHGMRKIASRALITLAAASFVFSCIAFYFNGLPPLWLITVYMVILFVCIGLTSGNLTSLSMQPLGKMAGIGAAITGFLSTLLSVIIAVIIGRFYNETTYPLTLGFMVAAILSLLLFRWIAAKEVEPSEA
ncbi:multidrug effflux MFS transporter [Pseudocolwellia sp. HL-MZ19]|uniref:multidrug effflux MFS transporter n=1 Tax=unclassified Pseudocolwellia TaxID=2848178 RepID=UPI003CFA8AAB